MIELQDPNLKEDNVILTLLVYFGDPSAGFNAPIDSKLCFLAEVSEVESVGPSCPEMEGFTACSVSPRILLDRRDEFENRGSPIRSTDSPSKRKGISAHGNCEAKSLFVMLVLCTFSANVKCLAGGVICVWGGV